MRALNRACARNGSEPTAASCGSTDPHVDFDSAAPVAVYFSIRAEDGCGVVWLRIDGGPMQTTYQGETLRFAPLVGGFAALIGAEAHPAPRSANLIVRPDSLGASRRPTPT